jgi:hypothetical protein
VASLVMYDTFLSQHPELGRALDRGWRLETEEATEAPTKGALALAVVAVGVAVVGGAAARVLALLPLFPAVSAAVVVVLLLLLLLLFLLLLLLWY